MLPTSMNGARAVDRRAGQRPRPVPLGRAAARGRGFSLAELMATIAITGILASIALAAFHRRANESDVAAAKVVLKAIAVAEEHYRAENQVYYDVSSTGDAGWYPQKTISANQRLSFWRSGTDAETTRWRNLAPDIRQVVGFGFKANAGLPSAVPVLDTSAIVLPANVAVEPWYVVQARTDADGDGTACFVAAASWSPNVVSVDDGE
jgi:prepilin-type N-terminal cleavage/methylation domain-containing protein